MADPCIDCGQQQSNPCSGASSIGWDCAVTSCMSQLGITENMALCLAVSQIATAVCSIINGTTLVLCVQNTAFVTPCGSDTTGALGDFTKPFKTIKAAVSSTTSNSGHLVYVYPGTYNESLINKNNSGVEMVGISFYFSAGVTVQGLSSPVFSSTVTAGTIDIDGDGVFTSTTDVFVTSTVNVTYNVRCKSIDNTGNISTGGAALNITSGSLSLNCLRVSATGGNCFNIRAGATIGYVTCNLIDNSNSATANAAVRFKDITVAGAKWIFHVGLTKSNSGSDGLFSTITLDSGNTGNPVIYYYGNVELAPTATGTFNGGIGVNTGTFIFEGDVTNTTGFGCGLVSISGSLTVRNSRIRVSGSTSSALSFPTAANGICILENCQLVSNAPTAGRATVIFYSGTPNPTLQARNCWIKNEDTTGANACISMNTAQAGLTPTLILDSCNLYSASATGTPLHTAVASNTRLTNCWANKANGGGGAFTNLIQAMNIDADLLFYIP
jgi:hypothetical protein